MLAISSQLIVVNVMPLAPSLFERGVRLRLFALIQTLSSSLLGGGAPLICHFLSMHFGDKVYASLYPLILSVISLACFAWLKNHSLRKAG
ncbi:MAG: hypothetical protein Q8K36_03920 [Alphaproteobacteria bacterium]|nr:hypothetical protein [Alphaproteobacteria bacterium]